MAEGGAKRTRRKAAGPRPGKVDGQGGAEGAVAQSGTDTPLDYMLNVMRDAEAENARRDQMARAAAPYVHRRKKPADKKGKTRVAHEDALKDLE